MANVALHSPVLLLARTSGPPLWPLMGWPRLVPPEHASGGAAWQTSCAGLRAGHDHQCMQGIVQCTCVAVQNC